MSPANVLKTVNDAVRSIKEKKPKTKFTKIIKSHNGTIIKVSKDENIDKLIKEDQLTSITKAYISKQGDSPTVLLKFISKLTDIKNINNIIYKPNPELSNMENKIKALLVKAPGKISWNTRYLPRYTG